MNTLNEKLKDIAESERLLAQERKAIEDQKVVYNNTTFKNVLIIERKPSYRINTREPKTYDFSYKIERIPAGHINAHELDIINWRLTNATGEKIQTETAIYKRFDHYEHVDGKTTVYLDENANAERLFKDINRVLDNSVNLKIDRIILSGDPVYTPAAALKLNTTEERLKALKVRHSKELKAIYEKCGLPFNF